MIERVTSAKSNGLSYYLGDMGTHFTPTQKTWLKNKIGADSVKAWKTTVGSYCTIELPPSDHGNIRFDASDWTQQWYQPDFESLTIMREPEKTFYNYCDEPLVNGSKREQVSVTVLGPSEIIAVAPSHRSQSARMVDSFRAEAFHLVDKDKNQMIAISSNDHYRVAPDFGAAHWHHIDPVNPADISALGDWEVRSFRSTAET